MYESSYQPYTLYRREDLWIREEFDGTSGKEQDINSSLVLLDPVIMRSTALGNGNNPFSQSQRTDSNGANYWSLYANQESAVNMQVDTNQSTSINNKVASFFEFKFDAGVFGPGILNAYVSRNSNKIIDPPIDPIIPRTGYGTNVYGNTTDLSSAQSIFGNLGFQYIFTDGTNYVFPEFTMYDIVVGGPGALGGVPDCGLATRLFGSTSFETSKSIQDYNNLHNQWYYRTNTLPTAISPIIPNQITGSTNVYGNTIDLDNAEPIFGSLGFNYFNSDYPSTDLSHITGDDIVLGGPNESGGITDAQAGHATRLYGSSRIETKNAVQSYNDLHHSYTNGGSYNNFYKLLLNETDSVEKFYGPCSWQISKYHRMCPGDWIQFYYYCGLRTDPIPCCEIDNLIIYPYYALNCEMAIFNPMKTDTAPKKLTILRGFNTYQTTTNISSSTDIVLRFYDAKDHTDFVSNCDKVHVLCDEKGITYRGVLTLGDVSYLGGGIYEQKVNFSSSNKLGVGWF